MTDTAAYGLWSLVLVNWHPQYVGFVGIMFGFLLQWPTLLTLVMFPVLVTMYVLLARREEKDSEAAFGAPGANMACVRRFVPHFGLHVATPQWR